MNTATLSSSLVLSAVDPSPRVPPVWFGVLAIPVGLPLFGALGAHIAFSPLAWLVLVVLARVAGLGNSP